MNVLISGAGIAGPTLAYWLARYGAGATLVEQAPTLRTGGYVIDFWGAGFEVAKRMGLLAEIQELGYTVQEVRAVNQSGRPVASFPAMAFTAATGGDFTSVRRGDLAATLFATIDGKVETIFGDSVFGIEQTDKCLNVAFERSGSRAFDLVIGADGLHSRIRQLVFGPESQFERYLGLKVAAFEAEGYRPRDELVYVMYTRVGQQVSRFAMRNDRTMFLFIFADEDRALPGSVDAQKRTLRERFGQSGWECPQILDALDKASDLYFDRVSQIWMNGDDGLWTKNRVTLVGDAAFCVSLLGGQGSALAMTAAYVLAGELRRANGDYREAFAGYERLFAPFVAKKQRAARRFAGAFAPKSTFSLFVRNQVFKLLSVPGWRTPSWSAASVTTSGFLSTELPCGAGRNRHVFRPAVCLSPNVPRPQMPDVRQLGRCRLRTGASNTTESHVTRKRRLGCEFCCSVALSSFSPSPCSRSSKLRIPSAFAAPQMWSDRPRAVVLMGGGPGVESAIQWMCDRSQGGDFLVIRASGNNEYNSYVREICPAQNSVATLVIPNRSAADDPFVTRRLAN